MRMRNLLFFYVALISPLFLFSQILTVNSGSSVSIASGSSITLDGLDIAPSGSYNIIGIQEVSRSNIAVTAGDRSSVLPVYNCSTLLSGFIGTVRFDYTEGELNNITESDLVLYLQGDDDRWTSFIGTVDESANTISYTFNDAVSFKAVTASFGDANLTVEDVSPIESNIIVYPNPTADFIFIRTDAIFQAELFDLMGRKVKATNQKKIDLNGMGSQTFILKVATKPNNIITSFKIIKQ